MFDILLRKAEMAIQFPNAIIQSSDGRLALLAWRKRSRIRKSRSGLLRRAWNENTPKLQQMFPRVMQTLLVQIESMVRDQKVNVPPALLERYPEPTDQQIKAGMNGNICRCNGYTKIMQAIRRAAQQMREVKVS